MEVTNLKEIDFNAQCDCGSGLAFASCHGKELLKWSVEQSDQIKFPAPNIVNATLGNYRLRVYGRSFFPRPLDEHIQEFIIHTLRWKLGESWYQDEEQKADDDCHVVMRWVRTRADFFKNMEQYDLSKKDHIIPPSEVMALTSLAADLYYMQLEGNLPSSILDRLRSYDHFQGARYEIAVAAALIRSGFKIEWISGLKSEKHCEFNAVHKFTGEIVAVEAKSRHRPGILHHKGYASSFKEIKADIFKLFNDALEHNPKDRPFGIFTDINLPIQADRPLFERDWVIDLKNRIEQNRESVFGTKPPTFVAITNYSWHYDQKSPAKWGENLMVLIPEATFSFKNQVTIEALGRSLNELYKVPDEE